MLVFTSSLLNSVAWLWGSVWSEAQEAHSSLSPGLAGDMSLSPRATSCQLCHGLPRGPRHTGLLQGQLSTHLVEHPLSPHKGLLSGLLGQRFPSVNCEGDERALLLCQGVVAREADSSDVVNQRLACPRALWRQKWSLGCSSTGPICYSVARFLTARQDVLSQSRRASSANPRPSSLSLSQDAVSRCGSPLCLITQLDSWETLTWEGRKMDGWV